MLSFLVKNTGEWDGLFFAVDPEDFIDITDKEDLGFIWRGVRRAGNKVKLSRSHPGATYIRCNDAELISQLIQAIRVFSAGKLVHRDKYGNIYTVSSGEEAWVKYRVHLSWEAE